MKSTKIKLRATYNNTEWNFVTPDVYKMLYLSDTALLFPCFCMHYTRFGRHKPSPPQQLPLLLQPHVNKYSLIPNSPFPNLLLLPFSFFQPLLPLYVWFSFRYFCRPFARTQLRYILVCLLTKVLVKESWHVSK